jgi:hypothetical protein
MLGFLPMITIIRYLMLLTLVVWLGGIVFFGFGIAPVAFSILPSRQLAGEFVSAALRRLHMAAYICGLVYLGLALLAGSRSNDVPVSRTLGRVALIGAMLGVTLVAQFAVWPRMARLRSQIETQPGGFERVEQTDPARLEFDRLHRDSSRLEGAVLIAGLILLYLT